MSNHKRTIWDDLAEIGREIVEQIGEIINPDQKRRKPVRVPVPVRNHPQHQEPQDDSYR
ncbi:MAG: hypothetical protein KC496_00070 [Anaerolineae bacterium]|nr:hypothetical protein [Anaerolineae bacterium]